jgi:Uncharacterized protein conserved in bacteria
MNTLHHSNNPTGQWLYDAKGILVWTDLTCFDTLEWMGNAINNYAWGKGKLIFYKDNQPIAWYEGNMKDGKCSGHGSFTYENGDVYNGEWEDGMPSGYGILQSQDGKTVEGDWLKGRKKSFFAFLL